MIQNQQPFFSIIMPVYNRSGMVRKSIDSVLQQDETSWELLVIDDGSKDDTADVIKTHYRHEPRIKYIYQENQERCVARNNGIKIAEGTYVCFLDSDDFYNENHLSSLRNAITGNHQAIAMFFTDCNIHSMGISYQTEHVNFTPDKPFGFFLMYSIIPSRVCIHHSILKDFNFLPHIVIGEDTILWSRIATRYSIFHVPQPSVNYQIHDSNSVNLKNNVFLDRMLGLEELFKLPEMQGRVSRAIKNRARSDCYFGIARHHEMHRRFFKMFYAIVCSLWYEPRGPRVKKKIFMIYDYF
jgi:glycosyltransferase involved in cell wall biosynthesis